MRSLVDLNGLPRRSRQGMADAGLLPLAICNTGPMPDWRIERLSEDRFRLTITVAGRAADDVAVFIEGGLLHVEDIAAGQALDCTFLLLEPLIIVRVELCEDALVVELERDHATPCKAIVSPIRREGVALALAA